ncbi:5-(carboxyamino)imidazole ribonucleotide synthase [Stenoxybacter acetivorans]|uniref:5-(carboxyamino)imidazole ribonucleotide synthase n=1 Tax=Stenoxybacter acetivorans TaxID=422441 RepID=UPI00055D790D|nr:5-(carboxyamino)imidazole ribonucleotide synthase [Stenoxybacter acetivorans]
MTTNHTTLSILPPAMLGILGGGQLGRMFTIAAKTLGYRVTVLDPDPNAPAAEFADTHLCAPFDDATALTQLAKCAAVTTEFENVSADAMRQLALTTRVSPSGDCVAIAQDREQEKAWIRKAGLPTAPYRVIRCLADINDDCTALLPGILKTATLGYDGKGQAQINSLPELTEAFTKMGSVRCVLEQKLDLHTEISVVVCRLNSDNIACFPCAENQHECGILAYSTVPARLPENLQQQAQQLACRLADTLDYVGVLAVEMFVVGKDENLVINEIAPRPHNSGHYTLDACSTDQFQQQVRLMCGLPPADTHLLSPCCMANILGDLWYENNEPNWQILLQPTNVYLHLYGKKTARAGRKMGHYTVLSDNAGSAYTSAKELHRKLAEKPEKPI